MLILIILLAFLLIMVGWLLIAPFRLTIDSHSNIYCLDWKRLAQVNIVPTSDDLLLQFKILFWEKTLSVFQIRGSKRKKHKVEKQKAKKRKWFKVKASTMLRKGRRVLKTFNVKACKVNLDTDDYILNSYLYPVFYLLNRPGRSLNINYEGNSSILLIIENRPYKILKAIIF